MANLCKPNHTPSYISEIERISVWNKREFMKLTRIARDQSKKMAESMPQIGARTFGTDERFELKQTRSLKLQVICIR